LGSVIISMPDAAVFSKYSVTKPSRPYGPMLAASNLQQEVLIGLAVMFEMALGASSPFEPWVRCLPSVNDLPMMSMWQSGKEGDQCAVPSSTVKGEDKCLASALSAGASGEATYILRRLSSPTPKYVVAPFKGLKDVERDLRKATVAERRAYTSTGYPKASSARVDNNLLQECLTSFSSSASTTASPALGSGITPLLEALRLCATGIGGDSGREKGRDYFSQDSYMYTQALLGSRAWFLSGDMVFVPFADMFNYAPVPPPIHPQKKKTSSNDKIFQRPFNIITDKPSFNFRTSDFIDHHSRIGLKGSPQAVMKALNNVYHPNPSVRVYTLGGGILGTPGINDFWEVRSDRKFPSSGLELFEYYGDSPNAVYFTYHGFAPGDVDELQPIAPLLYLSPQQNPHEVVGIPISKEAARAVAKLLPRKVVDPTMITSVLELLKVPEFGDPLRLYPLHAASVVQYGSTSSSSPTIDPVLLAWSLGPALSVMPASAKAFSVESPSSYEPPSSLHGSVLPTKILTCMKGISKTLPRTLQSHKAYVELLHQVKRECLDTIGSTSEAKLWRAKLQEMRLRAIQQFMKQAYGGMFGTALSYNTTSTRQEGTADWKVGIFVDERKDVEMYSRLVNSSSSGENNAINVLRFRLFKKRIMMEHYLVADAMLRKLKPTIANLKKEMEGKTDDEL
jgi:hypothetical protein